MNTKTVTAAPAGGGLAEVLAVIRDGFDLVPRVSEDDPMAPALADWMRQLSRAQDAVAELIAAARVISERISYYAELGESAEVNIEDWAYTDNSSDIARFRAALSNIEGASHG